MSLPGFNVKNPTSIQDAADTLNELGDKATPMAGGTDLLHGYKDRIYAEYPETLVNLRALAGTDDIVSDGEGVRIGALATLHAIETNALIKEQFKALAEAAHAVASPQIRNAGTIGGNICQEPRCWYYRTADNQFPCLRKGGALCNAFTGQNQIHSIFGVAKASTPPCQSSCPAGNAIPAYFAKLREGDVAAAAKVLLETNPLAAITGRVCPHFCEESCNRDQFDEAVSVRAIERFVGDYILENHASLVTRPAKETCKKVAVVGAGPAGLSAAFYLRQKGHAVAVLERLPEAGGMLRYGIPAYRLPKNVVAAQAGILAAMGVEFTYNTAVGKDLPVEELARRFDAVFVAGGAWKERPVGIAGEDYVVSGLEFLNRVNLGVQEPIAGKVAVIGGGNVAMDVARTLLRIGATPVVVYRRTQAEMPAIAEDVEKALEEGIEFQFLTSPMAVRRTATGKIALTCRKMQLGAPDASGRPRPVPIEGSEFEAEYGAVMKAIGETADMSLLPDGMPVIAGHLGGKLFAGGDYATGPSTVVAALNSGREMAALIDAHLTGRTNSNGAARDGRMLESFGSLALEKAPRAEGRELAPAERVKSAEVEETQGLTWDEVRAEANRCHNCGCVAVSPSDTAPALIALGAKIKTTQRVLDAEELFAARVLKSTVLEPGELVTEIQIPAPKPATKQAFLKFRQRKSIDFPIVAVAAAITRNGDRVDEARIALGAVAPIPIRATAAEEYLKGKELTEETARTAAEMALSGAIPLEENAYKIQVTKGLVRRAILACR